MKKIKLGNRNLRDKVYEVVRNHVISHEVAAGGKINEDFLSKALGVSKTPIREALAKLAHDGIVEIRPNRGSYKVKLSNDDILEILTIREVIEGLCFRLAAKNINDQMIRKLRGILDDFEIRYLEQDFLRYSETLSKFYSLIYNTAKSPRLTRIIQGMYDLTQMLRSQIFSTPESVKRSLKLHRELVNLLEKQDAEKAEQYRKNMLRVGYESILEMNSKKSISIKERKGKISSVHSAPPEFNSQELPPLMIDQFQEERNQDA
jgi:DNA-binding GntR family transcriptional regulator